jgi:predicted amidohydrolase YtcJ
MNVKDWSMRILYNAQIYTQNPHQPAATALAIQEREPRMGRILAVGEDENILSEFRSRAQVEDMGGRIIIPSLTDSHLHLYAYAFKLRKIDCATPSREECIARVAERVNDAPPGAWIQGHGWNQNDWPEGFGTAADLDNVAPNNPVYLTASSLHVSWVNSAALDAAGINSETPDPLNGELQRDSSGAPSGILFENAADLVANIVPQPSLPETIEAINEAQRRLWQLGITGLHDFDGRSSFMALQSLQENGQLGLRVLKHIPRDELEHAVGMGLRSGFGDDLLRIGSIKIFSDGALGPYTAAMIDPYEGEPDNFGNLFLDRDQLFELGRMAVEGGLSLSVHAIGDRANHEVLGAYSQLRDYEQQVGSPALRHRIEHVQVLHQRDLARLAQLEIIASVQPIHTTSDMRTADKHWGERTKCAYAFRTLLDNGTHLSFGSDAPVESANPFLGIHAAVTRRLPDGEPGPQGWHPEQRIPVEDAIRGYTTGPAYTAGIEARSGMFSPGYLADLIVLEDDPFTCDPELLCHIQPMATMLGGDWVWRR